MTTSAERSELDRVDDLLVRLPPPQPLSPAQVARIRSRIDSHHRRPVMRRFVMVGAVGFVLFGAVAVAMSIRGSDERPAIQQPAPVPDAQLEPSPPVQPPPQLPAPEPPPVVPPTTITVDAPPPTAPKRSSPARVERPVIQPAQVDERTDLEDREGSLGAESRLLGTALRQLRQQRSPRAALATLDQYAAQFPNGVLAAEARAARIEALLASGNKAAALTLLDAGAVKSELAVARGELRLEAGRIEEAARDFDSALIGANDELEERALFGRAACRVRLGDTKGARHDLEMYLRRFPSGRSAEAAKTVLERIR